jgi:hypothetical protein
MGGDDATALDGRGRSRVVRGAGVCGSVGHDELALGGSLGVELFRSEAVFVDLQSRLYGLVGRGEGTHFAVQPLLGVNFAY